jgi:glycosyltransferase involved in cell wall biosynthesis
VKFIVAQIGARRGYAVPAILEQHGLLERFYTDLAGNVGLGRILSALPFVNSRVRRLMGRQLPETIRARTVTFTPFCLSRPMRKGNPEKIFRTSLRWSNELGNLMASRGFGEATHLYSMLGECAPLLIAAREHGLRVVIEIYILLSAERILAEERKQFPGWDDAAPDYSAIRREMGLNDLPLAPDDFALCPSEAVRNDLVANFGVKPERCAVVPYGMNREWLKAPAEPVRGRVLFAGTADLRKGIHYFAMAAERLLDSGKTFEFRVAGNVQPRVAAQSICRRLNFLGRVPRTEIAREFTTADVLVLPSLAEGSAEVTYEALACGLPVITTKAAGSVVRDGVEGRIVPERDPMALAEAIREVVEDRNKRDRMAHAARERARDYTWEKYGERLVMALRGFS